VEPLGSARFQVSFTPRLNTAHYIHVTFNEEPVPGEPGFFKGTIASDFLSRRRKKF
jgi:hypothetical protein